MLGLSSHDTSTVERPWYLSAISRFGNARRVSHVMPICPRVSGREMLEDGSECTSPLTIPSDGNDNVRQRLVASPCGVPVPEIVQPDAITLCIHGNEHV